MKNTHYGQTESNDSNDKNDNASLTRKRYIVNMLIVFVTVAALAGHTLAFDST